MSVLCGAAAWEMLRLRFRIGKKTVVLILTGENRELDRYALIHLQDYLDRKYEKKAVVIYQDKETYRQIESVSLPERARVYEWSRRRVEKLFSFYSFYCFSDRVVFTYTDRPADNLLGRLLRETVVGEEEAVCLGLYRLRKVIIREKGPAEEQG